MMDNNWRLDDTEQQRLGAASNNGIGLRLPQPALPPQAYGLGAPAAPSDPASVENLTAREMARMLEYGSGEMGNIGAMQKRAAMQPDYTKGLRAPEGSHWTRQASRAMSGIGQGMAALSKEAMLKTAGDQQKYALDLMTKPEMQTEQAKMLRNQVSDAPEATTKMDIFKGKLPDWLKNWGA